MGSHVLCSAQTHCDQQSLVWSYLFLSFPLSLLSRKCQGATSAHLGSERIDALRYQHVKKTKKMTMNNNNFKSTKKTGVHPVPLCSNLLSNGVISQPQC